MHRFLLISCGVVALAVGTPRAGSREVSNAPDRRGVEDDQVSARFVRGVEAGGLWAWMAAIPQAGMVNDQVNAEPRRLQEEASSGAACDPKAAEEQRKLLLPVDEYTLQATFNCKQQTAALSPAISTGHTDRCFGQEECQEEQPITTVLDGVQGVIQKSEAQPPAYTITLQKMPNRRKKMYLKCTDPSQSEQSCVVTVAMPAEPSATTCTPNKVIALSVTESQKKVQFVCQTDKGERDPEDSAKVYEGGCTGPAKELKSVLPGSSFQGADSTYTLTVANLPENELKLCYKCKYDKTPQAPVPSDFAFVRKPCEVTITVAGTASGGSSGGGGTATTTQATSSASITRAASLFLAIPIIVAVTGARA